MKHKEQLQLDEKYVGNKSLFHILQVNIIFCIVSIFSMPEKGFMEARNCWPRTLKQRKMKVMMMKKNKIQMMKV